MSANSLSTNMPTCAHRRMTRRYLGEDPANGRYADVHLESCPDCGRHWLHYAFDIEAFSRSGRWYRGELTAAQAADVTAENAASLLESLPAYEAGGSYFDGQVHTRSGPLL